MNTHDLETTAKALVASGKGILAADESLPEGLDGLRARLAEYSQLGARFTKWRAVITIGPNVPSRACLEANARALAQFAALRQEAELVPIVEPEVLMDGDHTIERHFEVTEAGAGPESLAGQAGERQGCTECSAPPCSAQLGGALWQVFGTDRKTGGVGVVATIERTCL